MFKFSLQISAENNEAHSTIGDSTETATTTIHSTAKGTAESNALLIQQTSEYFMKN